jgi:glutaminyl-tRNA synthetase
LPDKVEGVDFKELINHNSYIKVNGYIEPKAIDIIQPETNLQFERIGYFVADKLDFNLKNKSYVFNKTVNLKDGWKK